MSYLYNNNPYNRRRPASPTGTPAGGGLPTLEDYQKLARAFEELKLRADEQAKQLKDKTTELTVKDEALHRQALAICHAGALDTAALSGGVFQNAILLEGLHARLTRSGLKVLLHHKVPANDGGIALGQSAVALSRRF